MTTYPDDYSAIRAVKSRLASLFGTDGDYGDAYQSFGGVAVVVRNDENSPPEIAGGLTLLLEQEDGSGSDWSSNGDVWRSVSVIIEAQASDFSGAQVAASNPTATQELLSCDLLSEFVNHYTTWRGLGIYGVELRAGKARSAEDGTVQIIPHRLAFQYQVEQGEI